MLLLASCSTEFDWDKVHLHKAEYEYHQNFSKKFQVPSDWDWDMSSGARLITRAGEATIIDGINFAINSRGNITKNSAIYDNMKTQLPEAIQHTGKPAILLAPANSFTIYPLTAQGAYTYDLYVKVGSTETKLFTKNWTQYDKPYVNGMKAGTTTVKMPGITINAEVGTPIQIYIKNIKYNGKSVTSNIVGTTSGNAIIVDCNAKPEGLPSDIYNSNSILKYIGIEDDPSFGDKDYNDITLLIIGQPDVPEEVVFEDDEYTVPTKIAKRYMVEDLGTTDDFDFNDIVFDVTEESYVRHKISRVKTTGEIVSDDVIDTSKKQYVVIRALGGTRDFDLYIGDTKIWTKSQPSHLTDKYAYIRFDEMYNTNYLPLNYIPTDSITHAFEVTGWDPAANNITFRVYPSGEESDPNDFYDPSVSEYVINFPSVGSIPYIIATDTDQWWNFERVDVFDEESVGNYIKAYEWHQQGQVVVEG